MGLLAVAAFVQAGIASAGYFVAAPVGRGVVLRAAPGGRVLARLGRHTAFGTPLALAVVERRGGWLGVTSDAVPNGTLGWIDARTARLRTVGTSRSSSARSGAASRATCPSLADAILRVSSE